MNRVVRCRNRLRVGDGHSGTVVGAPTMVESRLKRFDQYSSVGPLRRVVQLDCEHVSKLLTGNVCLPTTVELEALDL